jgi:hypothetical protein
MAVDTVVFGDPSFTQRNEQSIRNISLTFLEAGVATDPSLFTYRVDSIDTGANMIAQTDVTPGAATYTLALPMAATTMQSVNRKRERAQLAVLNSGGATIGVLEWGIEGLVGVGS